MNNPGRKAVAKQRPGGGRGRGRGLPTDSDGNIVPGNYKVPGGQLKISKIQRAEQANVLAVAKAMNPDLAPKVKTLFEPEMLAVREALDSGWYFAWRPREPPFDRQDCQRIHQGSVCFCGHQLHQHKQPSQKQLSLPCSSCRCQSYEWVPTRPEEAGEFWLQRRRDFDPSTWRAKCRCKHTHEEHRVESRSHPCRRCPCAAFASAFLCAACDQPWQSHETVSETESERLQAGRPVGEDWVPFAEMEEVKHMVLHGREAPAAAAGDRRALPSPGNGPNPPGNDAAFPGNGKSAFKPVYD